MAVFDRECFLFVPDEGAVATGIFYSLEPVPQCASHSVILIPYSNPTSAEPVPLYFKIVAEQRAQLPPAPSAPSALRLKACISKQEYLQQIKRLKEHIQRGDIYEINYCVAYEAKGIAIDPLQVFRELRARTQAPYSMLFKYGQEYILSASPELFLKREGNTLLTKPIKGTAARGRTEEEDAQLKFHLQNSLKEKTENVMAVDVARNDLSIIATRGSVAVPALFAVESFATVHQLVSTVTCEIPAGISLEEIFKATFPMASMTGAPKKRAMDICTETEKFERRYYSGALGIYRHGDFELGVLIRSIFYNAEKKEVRIAVGGAITHLCEAETEYEECQLKARSLLGALKAEIEE
jgi:para-aminobenzoate synthetase component I